MVRLRLIAAQIRLSRVTWDREKLVLVLPPEDDVDFYEKHFQAIVEWIMQNKDMMHLEQDKVQIRIIIYNINDLNGVESILTTLHTKVWPGDDSGNQLQT